MKLLTFLIVFFFSFNAYSVNPQKQNIIIKLKNGKIDTLNYTENLNFTCTIDTIDTTTSIGEPNENDNLGEYDELHKLYAFPNPSNSSVNIYYTLHTNAYASFSIFDSEGNLVKSNDKFILQKGFNDLSWDCTNNENKRVAEGIYIFQLKYHDKVITQKIVVSR